MERTKERLNKKDQKAMMDSIERINRAIQDLANIGGEYEDDTINEVIENEYPFDLDLQSLAIVADNWAVEAVKRLKTLYNI